MMLRVSSAVSSFIALYNHPKIIAILLLGFSSGLPLALTLSTLSVWLTEAGVSKTSIGLFAIITLPYSIKFLWAPLIDHIHLPYLTKWLGRRRSWMIVTQILLIIAILGLAGSNPAENAFAVALWALIVVCCSASQDIVIDAYRIELLEEEQQGAGAAVIVLGYRMGMLVSGAGALFLADMLSWLAVYSIMACLIIIGMIAVLLAGEPNAYTASDKDTSNEPWIYRAVIAPFVQFMQHTRWYYILLFIMLYKLGDAFAGIMTNPFLLDMGFSKTEIAQIVKTFGFIATLAGAFIGGFIVKRLGFISSLWICGILQMLSNLCFVAQVHVGYHTGFLALTIAVENIAGGMGTAAFVAYISHLCNRSFTATQYALLSSLASLGRTLFSSSSGVVVDQFGWVDFFLISTMLALPGLIMLRLVTRSLIVEHSNRVLER